MTEILANLPYVRTFPRWMPPAQARGNTVSMKETRIAEAALRLRLTGQVTAKIEEEMGFDPDVAFESSSLKPILNPAKLQTAILRKPMLALSLAQKAAWANKLECAKNIGTLAELAWQFHLHFPEIDISPNVRTLEEDPHYAWRAITELTLPKPIQERFHTALQPHPLYRMLSQPTAAARWEICKANKDQTRADLLVYLFAAVEAGQLATEDVELFLRSAITGQPLTPEEREILAFVISSPNLDQPGELNYISSLALDLYGADPKWLHHLAKHRRRDGEEFLEALLKHENTLGWILQTLWDIPELLTPNVLINIEARIQTPEQKRDIIRWAARFTVRAEALQQRQAA